MGTYKQLVELAVPTRRAATLLGLSRTTIYRKPAVPRDHAPVVPPNKLSAAQRAKILATLNSPQFVDLAPLQVYSKLLDAGIYLGSVSTFYRVLEENRQVKERRAWPSTHPVPSRNWWPPPQGRCIRGISRSWPVRSRASTSTAT